MDPKADRRMTKNEVLWNKLREHRGSATDMILQEDPTAFRRAYHKGSYHAAVSAGFTKQIDPWTALRRAAQNTIGLRKASKKPTGRRTAMNVGKLIIPDGLREKAMRGSIQPAPDARKFIVVVINFIFFFVFFF